MILKLWITAGGTGSAWHIASIAKKYYTDEMELYISDINEKELVAAASLADHFFQVPPVKESGYAAYIYELLKEHHIDVIIPLIPWEQRFFAPDLPEFAALKVKSLAPVSITDQELNDKSRLYHFCRTHGLPVIRQYTKEEITGDASYFCKPSDGFGAAGAAVMSGREILEEGECASFDWNTMVVQEYCAEDGEVREVTVEAFWDGTRLRTICRRRLEHKNGVCTKARIEKIPETEKILQRITELLEMPAVFNVQFVQHEGGWKIMDVNLRLAAGTGLSNAAGFQLIRALLAHLLGKPIDEKWFCIDEEIKTILRVYQEVVVR